MIKKVFIYLFLLFCFLLVYVFFLNLPSLSSIDLVYEFEVKKGWGVRRIAKELKEHKLIKSEILMIMISYFFGSDTRFKEGKYFIKNDFSTFNIYEELIKGSGALSIGIDVTIPEGYSSRRIALKLRDFGIIKNTKDFIDLIIDKEFILEFGFSYESLEGFLFPDTYKFYKGMNIKNIIRMFINNFLSKLESIKINFKSYSSEEFYNKIIIASIVEREYRVKSEAAIMSSVFHNRIRSNMALESCATIEYIITEKFKKKHPKRIYFADLEINSPYNTYINKGYPPTPISNAGIIALQAAFFPKDTNYLFFVIKDPKAGTHKFSFDYSDHLLGAKDYIKNFITKD